MSESQYLARQANRLIGEEVAIGVLRGQLRRELRLTMQK
jgi:hypothetical protein